MSEFFLNMACEDSFSHYERLIESNKRSGPCEDDYETTAPYIGILPEETESKDSSPLRFESERYRFEKDE